MHSLSKLIAIQLVTFLCFGSSLQAQVLSVEKSTLSPSSLFKKATKTHLSQQEIKALLAQRESRDRPLKDLVDQQEKNKSLQEIPVFFAKPAKEYLREHQKQREQYIAARRAIHRLNLRAWFGQVLIGLSAAALFIGLVQASGVLSIMGFVSYTLFSLFALSFHSINSKVSEQKVRLTLRNNPQTLVVYSLGLLGIGLSFLISSWPILLASMLVIAILPAIIRMDFDYLWSVPWQATIVLVLLGLVISNPVMSLLGLIGFSVYTLFFIGIYWGLPSVMKSKPIESAPLWRVAAPNGQVSHVFGTIHLGVRYEHLPAYVRQIFQNSKQFAGEHFQYLLEAQSIQEEFANAPRVDSEQSFEDMLEQEDQKKHQARVLLHNYKESYLALLETLNLLSQADMGQMDQSFAYRAYQNNAFIYDLSSPDSDALGDVTKEWLAPQKSYFSTIRSILLNPWPIQLRYAFQLKKMFKNYATGPRKNLIEDPEQGSLGANVPERNAEWIYRIKAMADRGSAFITMGFGHLYGRYGVLSMLEDLGYQVEPVTQANARKALEALKKQNHGRSEEDFQADIQLSKEQLEQQNIEARYKLKELVKSA